MAFKIDEVPKDVQWVWNVQMVFSMNKLGVGLEAWHKCQTIINNYPEWFPANPKEELPVSKERMAEIQGGSADR